MLWQCVAKSLNEHILTFCFFDLLPLLFYHRALYFVSMIKFKLIYLLFSLFLICQMRTIQSNWVTDQIIYACHCCCCRFIFFFIFSFSHFSFNMVGSWRAIEREKRRWVNCDELDLWLNWVLFFAVSYLKRKKNNVYFLHHYTCEHLNIILCKYTKQQ